MGNVHDTLRLLREVAHALTGVQVQFADTLPVPDDLDEFLADWDIPQEHHQMFRRLAAEAEDAFNQVDNLERQVRMAINTLVPEEKS